MTDDRLDLSSMDSLSEPARFDALVGSIHERAMPELARRAARGTVFGILGNWAWPTLAAASLVAVLSGGALALARPPASWVPVLQALRVSEPLPSWLEEGRAADTTDLLLALEGDTR
jgi:hypothetical protein